MVVDRHTWIASTEVRRDLDLVETLLARLATEADPRAVLHHQLLSERSKRLRAAFVLLSACYGARLGAREREAVRRSSAAVELVHEATLYHDDIVDESPERRGAPTAWGRFGARVASMAGTELLFSGARLCADLPFGIKQEVARTARELALAQRAEVERIGDVRMVFATRLRIMVGKTASLFRLAAHMGSALAGTPAPLARQLLRFAFRFGMCFQLADDLRDLVSDREALGRDPGSDLRDGVYTLPVIAALGRAHPTANELSGPLKELLASRDNRLSSEIAARLMTDPEALSVSATLARWLDRTVAALPRLNDPRAAEATLSFASLCRRLGAECTSPQRSSSHPEMGSFVPRPAGSGDAP